MMEATAQKAIEETRPKRFQLLGLNLGPDTTGNLTVNGRARYFAPFGENFALQAGGEYFRYLDRQEGQFDVGLVNRYKNFQAGLFSSFKRVELKEYSAGGTLGQAAWPWTTCSAAAASECSAPRRSWTIRSSTGWS